MLFLGLSRVRWGLLAAVLLSASTLARPGLAESSTPMRAGIEELLRQAQDELVQSRPGAASALFDRARELHPSFETERRIADIYASTGRVLQARATYEAALQQFVASLSPEQRALAERALSELTDAVALFDPELDLPDAELTLDGAAMGRTPLAAPVALDPGPHQIEIRKPGYLTLTQTVVLHSGENRLRLTLSPRPANVVVSVSPSIRATLLVDGRPVGNLPWQGQLPPGEHVLMAQAENGASQARHVVLAPASSSSLILALVVQPAELWIQTGSEQAEIYLDQRLVGRGLWRGTLQAGPHRLRVEREGYRPHQLDLDLRAGETFRVEHVPWEGMEGNAGVPREGLTAGLDLFGILSPTATNAISEDCPADRQSGGCSWFGPFGGGADLRLGYKFSWLAPELTLLGMIDATNVDAAYGVVTSESESAYYGPPRSENYTFYHYGWGLLGGARILGPRIARMLDGTASLAFGLLARRAQYTRVTTAVTRFSAFNASADLPDLRTRTSAPVQYYAPGFSADVGVLLGQAPGARLRLGALMILELAPSRVTADGERSTLGFDQDTLGGYPYGHPPLDVTRGPQLFLGLTAGIQFGS